MIAWLRGNRGNRPGAGLGLAVAKEVIEAHGGHIVLVPDVPEGATFRVYLPLPLEAPPEIAEGIGPP